MKKMKIEEYEVVTRLDLKSLPAGKITCLWVKIVGNGMGALINVPVIVAKGLKDGPVLGITAVIHGDELNGLSTIHGLIDKIDVKKLCGTIVAVPVLNVPGYLENSRAFNDGTDLNRIMPGKKNGTSSQVYGYRIFDRIIRYFDYLIDLHTASFGRINSLYVRANLEEEITRTMAMIQNPQIIVHKVALDKTLRGAAMRRGIPSITVEIGNPMRFQKKLINHSITGIINVLAHFKMLPQKEKIFKHEPAWCNKSYWMYTSQGGALEVYPDVNTRVKKGELVARVKNVFGDIVEDYFAPDDGIVIGKSTNPVNQTGSRILHLGIENKPVKRKK